MSVISSVETVPVETVHVFSIQTFSLPQSAKHLAFCVFFRAKK